MTWPFHQRVLRIFRAFGSRNLPAKQPAKPLGASTVADAPQSNDFEASRRSFFRVCIGMQQKQYAINGWNYAVRFRS